MSRSSETINPWRLFHGAMLPNWLLSKKSISATAKLVYARLCQYAGKNGVAYPRKQTLADAVGISRDSVSNCLVELRQAQLVSIKERRVPGSPNKSNEYRFLYHPWMEEVEGEGGVNTPLGGSRIRARGVQEPYIRDSSEVDSHEERKTQKKTYRAAEQHGVHPAGEGKKNKSTEVTGDRSVLEVIDGGLSKTFVPRLISEEATDDLGGLDNHSYVGEDSESMATEDLEERLKIARATANFAKLRADKQAAAREEARVEKERRRELATGMTKAQEREARRENRLADVDRPKTAADVERWFHEGMRDFFPDVTDPKWDVKDRTQAKRLLEAYKAPLVERAVRNLFVDWANFREKHKKVNVGPIPTISLLYGWRKAIFAELELNQTKAAAVAKPAKKFW